MKLNFKFPLICLFAFALGIIACKSLRNKENTDASLKKAPKNEKPMPTLPLPGDYAQQWAEIDSLEQIGLYKSALEKAESLHTLAKNDKNQAQTIKALLYIGKNLSALEEDGFKKALARLESEEKNSAQPEKSVLQSILGEVYSSYLMNQGWNLSQRTPIADGEGGDILTWSAAQIERRSLDLYAASIQASDILMATPIENFAAITTQSNLDSFNNAPLRPTLFDVLAHRALDHYSNESNYLTEPVNAFVLDQKEAFDHYDLFVDRSFPTEDKASRKWLTIQMYQQLLRRNLPSSGGAQDLAKARLIDIDLKRLGFVHLNSSRTDKDELYAKALDALFRQFQYHNFCAEILLAQANFLYSVDNYGDKIQNQKAAHAKCEDGIKRFPGSLGAQGCANLKSSIEGKELTMECEEVAIPNKSALVSVSFRNIDKIWIKVVRGSMLDQKENQIGWEERTNYFLSLPEVQKSEWVIADPKDFQYHRTELMLKGLPAGRYHILCSSNAAFDKKISPIALAHFNVSNIGGMAVYPNQKTQFVLADRETGAPLENVTIQCYTRKYESNGFVLTATEKTITNKNGMAVIDNIPENVSAEALAILGTDSIWIGNVFANRYRGNGNIRPNVHFFTDRAIYRPGQTIYFKGILYKRDDQQKPSILPNETITVIFYDVNGQQKSTLQLKSNEFGSINGTFMAPSTGLTGYMSIGSEGFDGNASFNVEEYKRPRFEVVNKPVQGNYKLGESIVLTGEAKNYAGNSVDGATVNYRVVRNARFPYYDGWYWWKRPSYFDAPEREIAFGKTTTKADGGYEITFIAEPDGTIPAKEKPVFNYTIYVDVTDISGETRSTESRLSVGYISTEITWDLPEEIFVDSLKKVKITAANLSGQNLDMTGEVVLQQLVAPKSPYLNRYWDRPDITTLTKQEFQANFPLFAWKEEDNPQKWDRQDMLIPFTFDTKKSKTNDLQGGKVLAGYYVATLRCKDASGVPIEIVKVVRVKDEKTRFLLPTVEVEKTVYHPGETANILYGSQGNPFNLFFTYEKDMDLDQPQWIKTEGFGKLNRVITENDRGGIPFHYFAIKNNRVYQSFNYFNGFINVPWDNKDLNISYETFRDKLSPGQKEEWRIKISGQKKEKVAAEMVATMYDASLDQFAPHGWAGIGFPTNTSKIYQSRIFGNGSISSEMHYYPSGNMGALYRAYKTLNLFGFQVFNNGYNNRRMKTMSLAMPAAAMDMEVATESLQMAGGGSVSFDSGVPPPPPPPTGQAESKPQAAPPAQIRRNLNETVFFFPEMRTDAQGNIILKFTMNEALTRWKMLTFAHTKDLSQVLSSKDVVTQKELMVIANTPRFLRAGDEFEFAAKVSNLSQERITGTATLNILDATSLQPLEKQFGLVEGRFANFTTEPGQSAPVSWKFKVPDDYSGAITWQIFADGKTWRDGEESSLPVVTNRMLVTETMPITVRGNQTKQFVFENLKNKGESNTLVSERYTLEFSSNPAWYAVQSLPYLMEYPHECSEQIFSRFYANTLASSVTQKMPDIRRIYDRWKGTDAMKSNLSKNQELKTALLEETPWVLDAQSEEKQKQNIALLFDLNRMADEQTRAITTLAERQLPGGGWPWFSGGAPNWYITQHIVGGFKHLEKLGALSVNNNPEVSNMMDQALGFCEAQMQESYQKLTREVQEGKSKWEDDHLHSLIIQYLYVRSFSPIDRPDQALSYYINQAGKHWLSKGLYEQGLLCLATHRMGYRESAQGILNSLRERATQKEELGMYWPMQWGYNWNQMPVETQALMVEVFGEVANDKKAVEELRIWLLKNKQTNRWESTKATAEAVYALLLFGDNWLNNTKPVTVSVGGKNIKPTDYEPGTGYFKQAWAGSEIKNSWNEIKVENANSNIAWGAAYWQYFEDLDKIKDFQKTPITIIKQLFVEENSANGPILKPITDGQTLNRGDKIKVRVEIRCDRPMEFVHLKDMRAAGFEPTNVLSGYRWQGGLGYYESTKDLATNFFIDYLPRGTYVFEYPLVASHRGNMSNGITTIQCMYAPEFTSHSKGIRVTVK